MSMLLIAMLARVSRFVPLAPGSHLLHLGLLASAELSFDYELTSSACTKAKMRTEGFAGVHTNIGRHRDLYDIQ